MWSESSRLRETKNVCEHSWGGDLYRLYNPQMAGSCSDSRRKLLQPMEQLLWLKEQRKVVGGPAGSIIRSTGQ